MKHLLLILMTISIPVSAGKIYQCSDKWGKPIYSDKPCEGAKGVEQTLEMKAVPKSGNTYSLQDDKTFDEIRRKRKIDSLGLKVKRYKKDIVKYRRSLDQEVAELENEQLYAANNLAGANYHASLSTKIQTVTQKYNSLVDSRYESIKFARAEIERLSKVNDDKGDERDERDELVDENV